MVFNPDYAVPPHETLQVHAIESWVKHSSESFNVGYLHLRDLAFGFVEFKETDVNLLANVTGDPRSYWRNRIRQYNATKKRLAKKPPKRKKGR